MIQDIGEAFQSHILSTNQQLTLTFSNFTNVSKSDVIEVLSALGSIQIQKRFRQSQLTASKEASEPVDISQLISEWNQKPKSHAAALLSHKKQSDYLILAHAFKQCHPIKEVKIPEKQMIPEVRIKQNPKQKFEASSSSSVYQKPRSKNYRRNSDDYDRSSSISDDRDRDSQRNYNSRSREWQKNRNETERQRERERQRQKQRQRQRERQRQRQRRSREKQRRYYGQDRQYKEKQRYDDREKAQSRQSYRNKDRTDRHYQTRELQHRDERYSVGYQDRYKRTDWQYPNYRNESVHQYPQVYNQRQLDNKQSLYQYYQQTTQNKDYYKRYG